MLCAQQRRPLRYHITLSMPCVIHTCDVLMVVKAQT
jgi:hypothetical protein